MTSDRELLRHYAQANDEEAFAALVQRHLNFVYSAALRQVNGDAHLAQDVTQSVFTDLALKALKLSQRTVLSGWLYTSAHYAAANAVRNQRRRQAREQEAYVMNQLLQSASPEIDWSQLQPVLDHSLHQLNESDREIVLLRYFENQPLRDIGQTLGLSEDTARKRVERALARLRQILSRKGLAAGATLGAVLSTHAVEIAPAGLAPILTQAALASAVTGSGTGFTFFNAITMSKLSTPLISGLMVVGLFIPALLQQRSLAGLRAREVSLTQPATQAAGLRAENQRLARLPFPDVPALPPDQLLELMKLRGEAGLKGQRLAKLQLELEARKNSATALALRTPATSNYFPKAAWATAGNATPEAALQSTSWAMGQAMSRGDIKAMLALFGPDLQARAATEMAGKTDREIQTELADQASRTAREEGFRIINKQIISPDEVVLTCYVDGSDSFSMMPLKKTANGWQITDMPAKK